VGRSPRNPSILHACIEAYLLLSAKHSREIGAARANVKRGDRTSIDQNQNARRREPHRTRICYAAALPWSRKLATPIKLNDGRTIATLSQARGIMLSLPRAHRRGDIWRDTADLLDEAAAESSYVPHTEAQFMRSLKTEGLI
jgi:hypothetical protein